MGKICKVGGRGVGILSAILKLKKNMTDEQLLNFKQKYDYCVFE